MNAVAAGDVLAPGAGRQAATDWTNRKSPSLMVFVRVAGQRQLYVPASGRRLRRPVLHRATTVPVDRRPAFPLPPGCQRRGDRAAHRLLGVVNRVHRSAGPLDRFSVTARLIARPARSTWRSQSAAKDRSSPPRPGSGWTGTAPDGSSAGSPAAPGWPRKSGRTRSDTRSSQLPGSTPGVPLRDVQEAASRADPRTTMRYVRQGVVGLARHVHRLRPDRRSCPVMRRPSAG
jgi:hypothetical protein